MVKPAPTLRGCIPCMVYLNQEKFEKMENDRGYQSRNRYLNEIIEKGLKQ